MSGITAGFDTFVTAMSIAYGLMVATVLLPDGVRRRSPGRPGAESTRLDGRPVVESDRAGGGRSALALGAAAALRACT